MFIAMTTATAFCFLPWSSVWSTAIARVVKKRKTGKRTDRNSDNPYLGSSWFYRIYIDYIRYIDYIEYIGYIQNYIGYNYIGYTRYNYIGYNRYIRAVNDETAATNKISSALSDIHSSRSFLSYIPQSSPSKRVSLGGKPN